MKKILLSMSFLFLVLSNAAFAEQGCKFQGGWIGFNAGTDVVSWMSTIDGLSSKEGTMNLDLIGFDATFGGLLPGATEVSEGRGNWKRISGNEFGYSVIFIVIDSIGTPLVIVRLEGKETLGESCDINYVTNNTIKIFWPDQNPFDPDETPWASVPGADHYGHRMTLN